MRVEPQPLPAAQGFLDAEVMSMEASEAGEGVRHEGVVKWFDSTRGFGFIVADDSDAGDILLHFSSLQTHNRRSLPEGARVDCIAVRRERGWQVREVLAIDLTDVIEPAPRERSSADRVDPVALIDSAGPLEPVSVKWFNRLKGYGFLVRDTNSADIFVHMETLRRAGIIEVEPDQRLLARIVEGRKGPLAVLVEQEH